MDAGGDIGAASLWLINNDVGGSGHEAQQNQQENDSSSFATGLGNLISSSPKLPTCAWPSGTCMDTEPRKGLRFHEADNRVWQVDTSNFVADRIQDVE